VDARSSSAATTRARHATRPDGSFFICMNRAKDLGFIFGATQDRSLYLVCFHAMGGGAQSKRVFGGVASP